MWNSLVRAVLRSPLHPILSRRLMLITIRGHSTGRVYTFPVGYTEDDGNVLVVVGHADRKRWWRNLLEPAPVTLRIRGNETPGTAVARSDPEGLREYLARVPRAAKRLHIPTDAEGDHPEPRALAVAAATTAVVTVRPSR